LAIETSLYYDTRSKNIKLCSKNKLLTASLNELNIKQNEMKKLRRQFEGKKRLLNEMCWSGHIQHVESQCSACLACITKLSLDWHIVNFSSFLPLWW